MLLKRAPEGTGVIAGGPARAVIRVSWYQKHPYKMYGIQNKQNVVLATIEGLRQLKLRKKLLDFAENLLMRFWLKEEIQKWQTH